MKTLCPPLVLSLFLFTSSKALAEGSPAPGPSAAGPMVSLVLPAPDDSVRSDVPVRPLLTHFAHQEGLHRYGEGALGVAGAGVLIGAGFATRAHDTNWSYALWITGGVVTLGSIASLLIPSELECLAQSGSRVSDQELRSRWGELARAKRLERRVGAVLGGLLGATGIVVGGLVLDREVGKFDDDPRRTLGTALIASGALGIVEGAVKWFVPSPIEVGYGLASRPNLTFAAAPRPSGFSVALTGAF